MRVAGLGRGTLFVSTLRALRAAGHHLVFVATAPENAESHLTPDDWRSIAAELGAPLARYPSTSELADALRSSAAELAVSINWPRRLPVGVLTACPRGIVNAHGGDLPRYRGNAPLAWAILNQEKRVGFTVHLMDEGIDTGPILLQTHETIRSDTTIGDLIRAMNEAIPPMMVDAVEGLVAGTLTGQVQTGAPLRCYPRGPEDGGIRWEWSAAYLDRLVRASSEPYAGAFAEWEGRTLTIWRARPAAFPEPSLVMPGQVMTRDQGSGEVSVATGDGVLVIGRVSVDGGGSQRPADVIRSVRTRLRDGRRIPGGPLDAN